MPGTGIKGYTGPSLYGGSYNISDGIIQGGNSASNNNVTSNGTGSSSLSNVINSMAQTIANVSKNSVAKSSMAQGVANVAGMDPSDYGDYIRQLLDVSANNTAQSQAFAREQMEFQRQSDANAMAWSAAEAQKNRDWQERLANTAHQREVNDLVAAGLNPILSANAGAYTGSGATGQGFSSSGAMGTVDNSATNAIGSLVSTMMNTASQASIAKLYTDASKYQADLAYSASRLNTEASIMNNQNTNSSQRKNVLDQIEADLQKTYISGEYGLKNSYINQETGLMTHAMDNQTHYDTELMKQKHEDTRTKSELTQRDKELLGAYERTALEVLNGNIWTTGSWRGLAEDAEALGREIRQFFEDPSGTYDKWQKMQREGSGKGSVLGQIFGWG